MPTTPKDLREHLVKCTLALLNVSQPEALSVREVARQAGVSSGAPYHHFGDKTGLLAACAEVGWLDLLARLEAVDPTAALDVQLQNQARVYVTFALERPGPYRLMMSSVLDDQRRFSHLAAYRARAMRSMLTLIALSGAAGTDAVRIKQRGVAVWSLLHGYAILKLDGAIAARAADGTTSAVLQLAVRAALLPEAPTAP